MIENETTKEEKSEEKKKLRRLKKALIRVNSFIKNIICKVKNIISKVVAFIKIFIFDIYKVIFTFVKSQYKQLLFSVFILSILVCFIGKDNERYDTTKQLINMLFAPVDSKPRFIDLKVTLCDGWKTLVDIAPYAMFGVMGVTLVLALIKLSIRIKNHFIRINCKKYYKEKVAGNSEFRERLFEYLEENITDRCLIITGKWGSGKTHQINEFFKEYQKYNSMKKYTVSCFAVENREQLEKLLKEEMKEKDDSLRKGIVDVLSLIPVVGEMLSKVYENVYSLSFLDDKDVIVLEDVERVTFKYPINGDSNVDQIDERNQRLSMVAGFANELVERHDSKVLIVCNREVIEPVVFNDVLYSKLASEIVEVPNKFDEIFKDLLEKNKCKFQNDTYSLACSIFELGENEPEEMLLRRDIIDLFGYAGIANIRDVEKLISNSIIYINLMKQKIDLDSHIENNAEQYIVCAVNFIYSLVFYHIVTELHITLSSDCKDKCYGELLIEEDELIKSNIMKEVCFHYPPGFFFVGTDEIEDIILHTQAGNEKIDRTFLFSSKQKEKMESNMNVETRNKMDKYSYYEVKLYLYKYIRAVYFAGEQLRSYINMPDITGKLDDKFEKNLPNLVKDYERCLTILGPRWESDFARYSYQLKEYLVPEAKKKAITTKVNYSDIGASKIENVFTQFEVEDSKQRVNATAEALRQIKQYDSNDATELENEVPTPPEAV